MKIGDYCLVKSNLNGTAGKYAGSISKIIEIFPADSFSNILIRLENTDLTDLGLWATEVVCFGSEITELEKVLYGLTED